MNVQILCIGKVKDKFNREQIKLCCDRINKGQHQISVFEYPDMKIPVHMKENGIEDFLEKEWQKPMQKITGKDYVVALCIEGKELSTKQHISNIRQAVCNEYQSVTYLIGGSLGLPEQLKKRANLKISFSKMTFPHQLMRVVLCEEIAQVLNEL